MKKLNFLLIIITIIFSASSCSFLKKRQSQWEPIKSKPETDPDKFEIKANAYTTKLFQRRCQRGDIHSCYLTGIILPPESTELAHKYFEKACKRKHARACTNIGLMDLFFKTRQDGALLQLEKACKNDAFTCYLLGNHYVDEKNDSKNANRFYQKACSKKYSAACFELGYHYDLQNDLKGTKRYYSIACAYNHEKACYNLGLYLEKLKSTKEAHSYFKKGCELMHTRSCNKLK
ncbi:MAG: sel1 repeat family protein [Halobacteriovoraceae bacterium]|jgi:TPR repeat protein|nr:sel1 repeat family protein [Halobacteriovoraceae bacterium]